MKPYLVGGLLVLAACDALSPRAPVLRIETLETRVPAGGEVQVRFTNVSTQTLLYNDCHAVLERMARMHWAAVGAASPDVPCQDLLLVLAPGASSTAALPLPAGLAAGTYRYRFTDIYGQDDELLPLADRVTNRFTVAP
ncbi:MAG: hypothetical protein ACREN5_03255 [Gemmatimonadales bacterium]